MKKSMMCQLLEFTVPGEDIDNGGVKEEHEHGGPVEWGVKVVDHDTTYGSRLGSGSRRGQ